MFSEAVASSVERARSPCESRTRLASCGERSDEREVSSCEEQATSLQLRERRRFCASDKQKNGLSSLLDGPFEFGPPDSNRGVVMLNNKDIFGSNA